MKVLGLLRRWSLPLGLGAIALCLVYLVLGAGAIDGTTVFGQIGERMERRPGPPPHGGPGGHHLFRMLDLTDEQRESIRAIDEAEFTAAATYHEQLRQVHEELRAATIDGTFDEAAIRAIAAKATAPSLEMMVSRARREAAVNAVLTPEQRQKLSELHATMPERGEKMHRKRH